MKKWWHKLNGFVIILLMIEFLDEFVYGAREAAWPLIRAELHLTYAQIGLLLGIPALIGNFIEPILGVFSDLGNRRLIVLLGGFFFALSLALVALGQSFGVMLLAWILFYPASGAFVSLSQAALMDLEPLRCEQNMARWTFAGSLGVVAGSLALGVTSALVLGWRGLFWGFVALTLFLIALLWRYPYSHVTKDAGEQGVSGIFKTLWAAICQKNVLRWLVLLRFSDLMLDVLLGYLALYMVDVLQVSPQLAGTAVAVWSGVGLLGDFLLIPLLEKVPGLRYLRVSAVLELLLFPAFLLIPSFFGKLVVLAFLGFFNAGWYSILKAQLYTSLPGRSGTAMALNNVFGVVGALVPWVLGLLAGRFGLSTSLWVLWLGPAVLLLGLWHQKS